MFKLLTIVIFITIGLFINLNSNSLSANSAQKYNRGVLKINNKINCLIQDTVKTNKSGNQTLSTTSLNFSPAGLITTYEKDSLRKAWYDYLSSLKNAGVKISADENKYILNYNKKDSAISLTTIPGIDFKTNSSKTTIQSTETISDSTYTFFVQIAASRKQMDSIELTRIYKGGHQIIQMFEDGWYKYRVYKTYDYTSAFVNLFAAKVKGAFIVVYKNTGQKMEVWEMLREKQTTSTVEFKVQIAASRNPMPQPELEKLYNGEKTVTIIEEEGWHKYQINAGKNFNLAKEIKSKISREAEPMI